MAKRKLNWKIFSNRNINIILAIYIMQRNPKTKLARARDRRRRKLRHARQLESRMKNEYDEYYRKMNNYEYDTWLSQVCASEEDDSVYTDQIIKKEYILQELVKEKPSKEESGSEKEYDIIDEVELDKSQCLIM
jgi:hypothetical protein